MTSPVLTLKRTHTDELAAFAKAAGDALRLQIVRVLASDSFGVLELAQIFGVGQSGMSHHLKVLTQAGLLATRREGNAIFYRRALPASALHSALLDEIDALPVLPAQHDEIKQVHERRAEASRAFFARSFDRFQAQQELIANLAQYQEPLLALLDSLDAPNGACALEVGPGDGAFLPQLAQRFSRVLAVDNSREMLELARQRCVAEGLAHVELRLADALQLGEEQVDCLVLNMVLHHFAAPAEALKALARPLKVGASLLISDLCQHHQSWVREACGDLWLGFEQDELTRWAKAAGLEPGDAVYVGLKNGFQIQLRQFVKPSCSSSVSAG